MMTSMIRCDNVMIHKIIQSFEPFINSDEVCRYFCTPSFDVIVKVKPFGFELNPQWCAASATYDAIEELTLVGNNYSNSTWWYHPGRMYFSKVKWIEIKEEDYELAKSYIIEKDNEIFSHINDIINT